MPTVQALPVSAQNDTGRTITLDVFRCPPGVSLQQMVAKDCVPITSGVDVTITSINGSAAPLTIADATLEGSSFRWSTKGSGMATDEWGLTHGTLPTGTTAFLVQGAGVVSGQSSSFDYRFTTSASSDSAFLDMYLLMAANAPVIEPPAATSQPGQASPEATAGLRPSPTPTTTPVPSQVAAASDGADAPVDAASDATQVAPADTGNVFAAGDKVVVSDGPVNLRSGAGTSASAVASLDPGTELTIVAGPSAANGHNWYQVKSSNQTGWVAGDFLQIVTEPSATFAKGDQALVFDGPVNLRASAGTEATVLQSLPQESVVTVLDGPVANSGHAWYQVQTESSITGWVAADFIESVSSPTDPVDGSLAAGDRIAVVDGPVNLRAAAGIGNDVVAVLQTGDTLNVTGGPSTADGYSWYQVTTAAGGSGWVASDFVKKLGLAKGDIVSVATDSLNVRSAAGLNSTVLDTIYEGTVGVIADGPTSADNREWYKIDVSGVTSGWVAAEYIARSDAPPVTPPTNGGAYAAGDWIFVSDPPLNLRDTPSTSGQILASLGDGDGLLVLGNSTTADGYAWSQVENDGVTGYVATDYVSGGFALGGSAVVADGPVNLRSGAGTNNSIVTSLAQGAQVSVLSNDPQVVDGVYWFQVTTTDSVTGWVAGRYLGPATA